MLPSKNPRNLTLIFFFLKLILLLVLLEHTHTHMQLNRYKTIIAFWFNEHELVIKQIEKMGYHNFAIEKTNPGFLGISPLYLYCALSCLSMARKQQQLKKKKSSTNKHIKRAKKFLSKFQKWAKKGNPNVHHYEELILGELASLQGNIHKAKRHYDIAIYLSGRYGNTADQALAHERLADHAIAIHDTNDATYHYTHALRLYEDWGALAKCDQLRSTVQELIMPVPEVSVRNDEDNDAGDNSQMEEGLSLNVDSKDCSVGGDSATLSSTKYLNPNTKRG